MSDYLKVFPDRYIKLQSGKIKIYSNQTTHQTLSKYNTEIDIFDNKKQMKEWVQGYIKKQKINLSAFLYICLLTLFIPLTIICFYYLEDD